MSDGDSLGDEGVCVAVIGMAGRFPGTGDVDDFWRHLVAGDELITHFPEAGNGEAAPAYGITPHADWFDADFFGYSPAEALLLDPQQRIFLECSWEALERAGYDPARYHGAIGVYGGSGSSDYARHLRADPAVGGSIPDWHLRLATAADFLTMRVSYKLGLTGPAITVQTACSTSLVAVHLAVQAILAGECDIALAGGITVSTPHPVVLPPEGGIFSPDGYCRPFDARAAGTVGADGAGVVVLKLLSEALADGDHVHATIRGSAVTNDGAGKVGFTAPGVEGQAAAVRAAYAVAGIDPATVGYVEAHGTGTPMGDPIEIRALTRAFERGAGRTGPCIVGSVKSNIGHADTASGVIGLIKAVLAVEHGVIPATLHFEEPNEDLGFGTGRFAVNSELAAWPDPGLPRRAGVNSLGIGGTNAHVVLEQSPPREDGPGDDGPQLLPLSARTPQALSAAAARLADHLAGHRGVPLADVAWTLQVGRREFSQRACVVATGHQEAARLLRRADGGASKDPPAVTFLFPGQGGQHPGMARELYSWSPAVRARIDACTDLLDADLGTAVRTALLAAPQGPRALAAARASLDSMAVAQPALFILEYATAGLWQSLGVTPSAVLGHSLGAYAAACTAGVISVPDALALVVARGELLGGLAAGAMLAVALSEAEIARLLPGELSIAAVNGTAQCAVAGPAEAVAEFEAILADRAVEARRIRVVTAAHSRLVDPVLGEFGARLRRVELRAPEIPWISDTHGQVVTESEARDPDYWVGHLRRTVRFHSALSTALAGAARGVLLEVGPGHTLAALARRHPGITVGHDVVSSLPHAVAETSARATMLSAAGSLWSRGLPLSWEELHPTRRHRVRLPTYPFERRRYGPSVRDADPLPGESTQVPMPQASAPGAPGDLAPPAGDAGPAIAVPADDKRLLACAFGEVLGLPEVDVDDNFFDLGGDSLIAARLVAVIRRVFDVKITVRSVLLSPSVSELLPHLRPQKQDNAHDSA